jgi:hypothetical protein
MRECPDDSDHCYKVAGAAGVSSAVVVGKSVRGPFSSTVRRITMHSRIALALGIAIASTGLVLAQVLPQSTQRIPVTTVPVDLATQVAALQQQVASLQAAVTALQFKTQLLSSNGISISAISAGSAVTVSPAGVAVIGPILTLNGSGRSAARVGDRVTASGPPLGGGGNGSIVSGSTTVLIGD